MNILVTIVFALLSVSIGCAVTMALLASVAVFANAHDYACPEQDHETTTTPLHMEGKHCSGTVGCDCPVFSLKTDIV